MKTSDESIRIVTFQTLTVVKGCRSPVLIKLELPSKKVWLDYSLVNLSDLFAARDLWRKHKDTVETDGCGFEMIFHSEGFVVALRPFWDSADSKWVRLTDSLSYIEIFSPCDRSVTIPNISEYERPGEISYLDLFLETVDELETFLTDGERMDVK